MADDRPVLSDDDARLSEARGAVDAFVAELQAGVDTRDADVFNGHFAADVLWGTPFGDTVLGYDTLHDVHRRMLPQRVGGASSRYETVRVSAPAPDVAVAQVRRVALAEDGTRVPNTDPTTFSEMTTFVLVRRNGQWWLAAGQHTPGPAQAVLAKQGAAQEELLELADDDGARPELSCDLEVVVGDVFGPRAWPTAVVQAGAKGEHDVVARHLGIDHNGRRRSPV